MGDIGKEQLEVEVLPATPIPDRVPQPAPTPHRPSPVPA